jgi:hypothetical protein
MIFITKMCITGHKVYNGQHQNVSGHHPSFLRKRWIGPKADKEKKKKQAALLYCLQ